MLQPLFRFVIPPALEADPVTRSHAEGLVVAAAVAGASLVPVGPAFGLLAGAYAGLGIAVGVLLLMLAVLSMRWLQRIEVAQWGTMSAALGMFVFSTWVWGGDPSMGIYQWFALVPVLAAYVGGMRFGLTWTLLSLLAAGGMATAHLTGWLQSNGRIHHPQLLGTLLNLTFIVTMAALSALLHRAKEQASQQLRSLARADLLTGLPNRRHLDERLARAMMRTRRQHRPCALLFLDLDHFKAINDTHGHAAGDTVLKAVASRLRKAVRETDTVARLAGDEFVILLEGLMDAARESRQVAAAVQSAMVTPIELHPGVAVTVGISIGIACHAGEPVTAAQLLAQADAALYRVKAQRRGGFMMAEEGGQPVPPPVTGQAAQQQEALA